MKMTGAETIVKCLEEQGVEVMFGFPGGVIIDLFDELEKSDITHVLVRHEQAAIHAADAYGRVKGDVGVAQKFQQLLHELEIDWEELASHWTGDTAARQLGRLARAMRHYLAEVRQSTRLNISEYLLYEKEIVPEKEEIDDFIREIATLRNDSERLFQRFDRLEKQVQGSS